MSTLAVQTPPGVRRWLVLTVVLAADVLDLLDSTITNIAAPTIGAHLGGGRGLVQWLGASYALALGVLLVIGGRFGDKFGRRRLFLIGLTGFTIASVACGLAFNPESIVIARLTQGAFGALVIPQGFGLLTDTFPRDQRAKAFSAFGPVLGLSAVGGPILAGALLHADLFGLGWRSMFLINIGIGGAAILAAVRWLPRDTGTRATAIDGLGSGLLAAAMLALLGGLSAVAEHDWTGFAVGLLTAGAVLFGLFGWRQRTADAPLIKPSLLRNRGFTSGLVVGVVFFAAMAGLLYVLSLFLQAGAGFSPMRTAVQLTPVAVGIIIASIAGHTLIARLGRTLVLLGLLLTLAGTLGVFVLIAAWGTAVSGLALAGPVLVIGLGAGACFGTVFTVCLGDIDPDEAGSAGGSLTAVQQLANAAGVAVVTTIYFGQPSSSGITGSATTSLLVIAASVAACCGLVPLMPRSAPAEQH